jgi:hypothetical protein
MCAYCAAPSEKPQDHAMNVLTRSLICAATVAVCAAAATPTQSPERITVSFSDPSRPGVLHVALITGSVVVKGADVKDVTIETRGRDGGPGRSRRADGPEEPLPDAEEQPPGLHRLPQQPSITVEEQNNRMSVASPAFGNPADLEIQVPKRTNLQLSTVNNGDVVVEGVDGELEVSNVNGSITLTGVGGSVVAHTVNGKVTATLTHASPQKPMAFTSLNGAVDVTLPATAKANLKLRTDNGSVFTDFDVHMLPQSSSATVEDTRQAGGRYRIEVNKVIYGAVNGGGPEIEARTFNGNIFVRKGS